MGFVYARRAYCLGMCNVM